jgi:hypothetical protein
MCTLRHNQPAPVIKAGFRCITHKCLADLLGCGIHMDDISAFWFVLFVPFYKPVDLFAQGQLS